MAALRNLSRLRESCERMATGDLDSTGPPLITMEDCYTIDGNRYEKREKQERKKFGETRIEKINKYVLEYRERQRNLLLRRDMINKKFKVIINSINQKILPESEESFEKLVIAENKSNSNNINNTKKPEVVYRNKPSDTKKIRELERKIKSLQNKISSNSLNFKNELNKYKNLGKNEEYIRKKLGLRDWNSFIEKVNDNQFEYKLNRILELINENEIIEVTEDITGPIEDKTLNDDEETEARRAKEDSNNENNIENFQGSQDKSSFLNEFSKSMDAWSKTLKNESSKALSAIGVSPGLEQNLTVYENIGKIKIKGSQILSAQANKNIDNSIELVGDFETLATDIISNIRERYYQNENTDYKKLVDKTEVIDNNKNQFEFLNNTSNFSKQNLNIQQIKNKKLKNKTKLLSVFVIITFVVSLLLMWFLL